MLRQNRSSVRELPAGHAIVLCIFMGTLFIAVAAPHLNSFVWKHTEAVVTNNPHWMREGHPDDPKYFDYKYKVGNSTFVGEARCQKNNLHELRKGEHLEVWYNPDAPAQSVVRDVPFLMFCMTIGCLAYLGAWHNYQLYRAGSR